MGRMMYNNLFCMGILNEVKDLLAEKGIDIAAAKNRMPAVCAAFLILFPPELFIRKPSSSL